MLSISAGALVNLINSPRVWDEHDLTFDGACGNNR
jgi:hypothetical protein